MFKISQIFLKNLKKYQQIAKGSNSGERDHTKDKYKATNILPIGKSK